MINVTFKTDFRGFCAGEFFEFEKGINFLVGDQGVGKSTLLNLITMKNTSHKEHIEVTTTERIQFVYFDFEKMNPRTKNHVDDGAEILLRFQSHGQSNNHIIEGIKPSLKECNLLIMDEPETALSIRSVVKLSKWLKTLEKTHYIIAATHNERLMLSVEKVFDLEKRKWISPEKFIKSQEKG